MMNDENWQERQNLDLAQRVTKAEVRADQVEKWQTECAVRCKAHELVIAKSEADIRVLVSEVKAIKNAIYFMALAIAANVPALQHIAVVLKGWLNL